MLVSVIIPAYQANKYIANAVYSALEQEGIPEEELEVIVIEDCGPDRKETDRAMARLRQDPQVTYLHNKKNIGAAASRNRGIDLAKGRYVAFLDADDWWEPDKLEQQLRLLERSGAKLCFSARALHFPDGTPTGRVIPARKQVTYEQLLRTNSIPCGSVVMDADIAREFHMTRDDLHEDYILWLQVLKKYGPAVGINEPYLHCRLSPGGKSRNKLRSALMQYRSYRYLGIGPLRSAGLFLCYALNGVRKYYG
jgi:teichuronic acid biosynthesis glycosyltransferase TuaG